MLKRFRRLKVLYSIEELDSRYVTQLKIDSPSICPVCGEAGDKGKIKLRSKKYTIIHKFFYINVCKTHYYEFKRKPDCISFIALIFPLPFFYFLFNSLIKGDDNSVLIFTLLAFISFGLSVFLGYIYTFKKDQNLRKYINVESFENGSIILAKNNDWIDQFKYFNICFEIPENLNENLEKVEEYEKKVNNFKLKVIAGIVITSLGFIINLLAQLFIIYIIFLVSSIILVCIYSFIDFFLIHYKIKNLKSDLYFTI